MDEHQGKGPKMRKLVSVIMAAGVLASPATVPAQQVEQDPVAVIESATAAYQARNREGFVAHFADDALLEMDGLSFEGRAQIRQAYALNFTPEAPRVRVVEREAYANRVIDTVEYDFNGQAWCCSVTAYFIENGKIVLARVQG